MENITKEEADVKIFSHRISIARIAREMCVDANCLKEPMRTEMISYAFYEAGRAGVDIKSLRCDTDQFNERVSQGII